MLLPLLGGSEQEYLVNDIGLGAAYESTEVAANAGVIITFKNDGTWEVTFDAGDIGSGTPLTGSWLTSGGVVADYQLRYTVSNEVGAPVVGNGAAAYSVLSSNRVISVEKNGANASADILVEIQRIVNPTRTLSDTTNCAANGAP
jgi:hypothetical protein